MKFLVITEYGNRIIEAEDFEAAGAEAEWHEGHGTLAIVLLDGVEE